MLSTTEKKSLRLTLFFLISVFLTVPIAWGGSFFSLDGPSDEQIYEEETYDYSNSYDLASADTGYYAENTKSGYFGAVFEEPFLIRGQSSDYWGTVQQSYTQPTYYVAQTSDAASVAPSLGTPTSSSTSSTATSSTSTASIAPPLTDVNTSILNPTPAPEAKEGETFLTEPVGTMKRFWDSFSFNYAYLCGGSANSGMAVHEFDLAGRFAIPCKCIPHANDNAVSGYWYIAPTFGVNLFRPNGFSWNVFDLALAAGSRPQFTKDFGADLWVQVGIGSTCTHWCTEAVFVRGRGLGTLRISEQIDAVAGVIYYGRNQIKLLPSGGVTWKPNDGNLWYLVFPNPKLSRFLKKCNETDWWAYIQGDIGGGRWYMAKNEYTGLVDYNDYRVSIGVTFNTPTSIAGSLEIGGAFARELYAKNGMSVKPDTAFFVKCGVMY